MKQRRSGNRYQRRSNVRLQGLSSELPVFTRRDSSRALRKQKRVSRSGHTNRRGFPLPIAKVLLFIVLLFLLVFLALRLALGLMPAISRVDFSALFQDALPEPTIELIEAPAPKLSFPALKIPSQPLVVHQVTRGQNLSLIAARLGLLSEDIQAIHASFRAFANKHEHPPVLKTGSMVHFYLNSSGQVSRFELPLSTAERFVIERKSDQAEYESKLLSLPKNQKERTLLGVIETSFAAAANKVGVPYDVVDDLVDLVGSRISFYRDFQKQDRFVVIYQEKVLEDGTSVAPGPILAAALQAGNKEVIAVRYVGTDGKSRYFDEKGKLIENSFLRYPLRFSRISSYYTDSRMHPILKRRRPHHGVDFAAPIGTPVRTVADGSVVSAGRNGAAGIMVKIKHSERYSTVYMHLARVEKGVRRGTRVQRGQVIGVVGSTGLSTGPHLDYRFIDRGRYVNPLDIKLPVLENLSKGNAIDKRYLKRVLFTLRHYQELELENSYWQQ